MTILSILDENDYDGHLIRFLDSPTRNHAERLVARVELRRRGWTQTFPTEHWVSPNRGGGIWATVAEACERAVGRSP